MKMKKKMDQEVEGVRPSWSPAPLDSANGENVFEETCRRTEVYIVISKENNDRKVETSLVELRIK